MRTVLFSSSIGDINADLAFTNNLEATTNPGVGNDSSQNYQAGSVWVNNTSKVAYICVSAAVGAAVWDVMGSGTSQAQFTAPAASSATTAGGTALLKGGAGGATSGAGGPADLTGGVGGGTGAGGAAVITGGASGGGATGTGGAATLTGGASLATNGVGGSAVVTGGAGKGTGAGAPASVTGGVGGIGTGGNGGNALISGGAAGAASNSNGGDVNLIPGAKDGTGVAGVIRSEGVILVTQGTPGSQDTSATLSAAQVLAGILTSNPSGAVNLQLPLATAMDTALPTSVAGDAFDFSVISIAGSTNLPTLTTNTGWTLVGAVTFTAVAGNAGRFRAVKGGAGAWTLYRIG